MNLPSLHPRRKARIEIVPLIDIIFFLLATFVMVSLSMIQNQGISVHLPAASSGVTQERQEVSTVTITAEGTYYLNKELLKQEELFDRLRMLKKNSADLRVFLNADAKADFGTVVTVLSELRHEGIEKVAIQTTASAR